MQKNEEFETQIFRELLPVIVQLTNEIDIPYIPLDVWNRIKEKVSFFKIGKGATQKIENTYIILIEGNMEL